MLFSTDDVCSANPCLNEGTCTPNNNSLGFECSCPSGYIGFNCGLQRGERVFLVDNFLSAVLVCMIPYIQGKSSIGQSVGYISWNLLY